MNDEFEIVDVPVELASLVLYAWVGPNDSMPASSRKDNDWGLKQGIVPAGMIPLVSVSREKVERQAPQMADLATLTGQPRYLARFEFVGICRVEKPE